MTLPLMPKATAVWLVENTALTFEQIADFCGMHPLEVQAIADGEVAIGMHGIDPVMTGQLAPGEIERCAADDKLRLVLLKSENPRPKARPRGARYTPVSKRQDRPDAIAWLAKNYPELSDGQISRLIGTTKPTINAVRDKTHWNAANIKPQNPISLGLCNEQDLEKSVMLARARSKTVHGKAAAAETAPADAAAPADATDAPSAGTPGDAAAPADTADAPSAGAPDVDTETDAAEQKPTFG